MKLLMATAIVMFAASPAMAGEFSVFGKIFFQSASTYVSANNVCESNGMLYHKKKTAILVQCDPKDGCDDYILPLAQPKNSSEKVCMKATNGKHKRCLEWGYAAYNQGTVEVEVYKSVTDWELGKYPARTYDYTVGKCKGVTPPVYAN